MIEKVLAQSLTPCADGTTADPAIGCTSTPPALADSNTNLADLLLTIANQLLTLIIAVGIVGLILAAIKYSFAAGDPEKMNSAKRAMILIGIGLVVSLLAKAGVTFLISFLQ